MGFLSIARSWYSCDPVELFEAPVQKKIRGDETQKKIEKTLVTEARQSQVRWSSASRVHCRGGVVGCFLIELQSWWCIVVAGSVA